MSRCTTSDSFASALTRELRYMQDRIVELYNRAQEQEAAMQRDRLQLSKVGRISGLTREAVSMATAADIALESTREETGSRTEDESFAEPQASLYCSTYESTPVDNWVAFTIELWNADVENFNIKKARLSTNSIDASSMDEYWGMHDTWSLREETVLVSEKTKSLSPYTRFKKNMVLPAAMGNRKFASISVRRIELDSMASHHGDILREDNQCPLLQTFAMNPDSLHRTCWILVGVIILCMDLVMVPMHAVSLTPALPRSVDIATCVYWLIDFPCQLFTGIHRDGLIDMRPSKTIRRYARTWMLPDLSFLLLDFVILLLSASTSLGRTSESLRPVRMIRMLRVIRAHKLKDAQKMVEAYIFSTHLILTIKLFWLILCMITFNHWVACAWYGISIRSDEQATWFTTFDYADTLNRYLAAFHWALCQFSPATVRIGPENAQERVLANCVAIFGLVVFSSFISNVTNSVNQLKSLSINRIREHSRMQDFLRRVKVSTDLGRRIQIFFKTNWNKSSRPVQESDLVSFLELPTSLKIRLHQEMHYPSLQLTVIYTLCDAQNLELLVQMCHTAMCEVYHCTNQDVFVDGTECEKMYYVKTGILRYYPIAHRRHTVSAQACNSRNTNDLSHLNSVFERSWLSEAALWMRWVHAGRLEASEPCNTVELSSIGVRDIVSRTRGATFRYMKMYAIMFVSYFEDMTDESQGCLSDLPIDPEDASMLVEKAFKLSEGVHRGILQNMTMGHAQSDRPDNFWMRWVTAMPLLARSSFVVGRNSLRKSWNKMRFASTNSTSLHEKGSSIISSDPAYEWHVTDHGSMRSSSKMSL